MSQSDAFRDGVKDRYGFSQWPRPALARRLRAAAAPLDATAALGLQLEKRWPMPDRRNCFVDTYRSAADPRVRFAVTVLEYDAGDEAREGLVDQLANVMAPSLPRADAAGIAAGEVGFTGFGPIPTRVLFVRGHVLVKVESVGDGDASVKDLAEAIDRAL